MLKKRPDGYHNIETAFYPINWCDALEILEHNDPKKPFIYSQSGLKIEGATEDNLIYKAWKEMAALTSIPPIKVHLHKNIPMGAGLGGGSSDAAHFIELLNEKFSLGFEKIDKKTIAAKLGSDCSFFLKNYPVIGKGVGSKFSKLKADLSDYYILIIYPGIHSNTKTAYEGLTLRTGHEPLRSILESDPPDEWKNLLVNDFEESIFHKFPLIKNLKEQLYEGGALYASLSGSGSSVFGIFEDEPELAINPDYQFYLQKPGVNIL